MKNRHNKEKEKQWYFKNRERILERRRKLYRKKHKIIKRQHFRNIGNGEVNKCISCGCLMINEGQKVKAKYTDKHSIKKYQHIVVVPYSPKDAPDEQYPDTCFDCAERRRNWKELIKKNCLICGKKLEWTWERLSKDGNICVECNNRINNMKVDELYKATEQLRKSLKI